jgi:hypothetical protein
MFNCAVSITNYQIYYNFFCSSEFYELTEWPDLLKFKFNYFFTSHQGHRLKSPIRKNEKMEDLNVIRPQRPLYVHRLEVTRTFKPPVEMTTQCGPTQLTQQKVHINIVIIKNIENYPQTVRTGNSNEGVLRQSKMDTCKHNWGYLTIILIILSGTSQWFCTRCLRALLCQLNDFHLVHYLEPDIKSLPKFKPFLYSSDLRMHEDVPMKTRYPLLCMIYILCPCVRYNWTYTTAELTCSD